MPVNSISNICIFCEPPSSVTDAPVTEDRYCAHPIYGTTAEAPSAAHQIRREGKAGSLPMRISLRLTNKTSNAMIAAAMSASARPISFERHVMAMAEHAVSRTGAPFSRWVKYKASGTPNSNPMGISA